MSQRVNPELLTEIKKYGAADISACFNCGNCTAVCPMTKEDETFPRRIIRYAQVGLEDRLLSSKELWLCYNCGECSETCPRQAEPGAFMAAARRYAISKYDRSGVAKLLFTSPLWSLVFLVVLAGLIALFMLAQPNPPLPPSGPLKIFELVPVESIHYLGSAVMGIMGLIGLLGILDMMKRISKVDDKGKLLASGKKTNWKEALWNALITESLLQKRFREDCETSEEGVEKPWYLKKWFLHASTMWGFLGLLAATMSDFFFYLIKYKVSGESVTPAGNPAVLWYFVHTMATIAGFFLMYGTSVLLYKRWKPDSRTYSDSNQADWVLLWLLWLAGFSGLFLEAMMDLPQAPTWGYGVFIFHVAVSMEVSLLAPLLKFGHAFYRPVALFFHALKPLEE